MSLATIVLRVLFGIALLAALVLPRLTSLPAFWRRTGIGVAIAAAVLLIALRIVTRFSAPEELPAASG